MASSEVRLSRLNGSSPNCDLLAMVANGHVNFIDSIDMELNRGQSLSKRERAIQYICSEVPSPVCTCEPLLAVFVEPT